MSDVTLKQRLLDLPPDAGVVWCAVCGHVSATVNKNNDRLQKADNDDCYVTIATGTPEECIRAMCG